MKVDHGVICTLTDTVGHELLLLPAHILLACKQLPTACHSPTFRVSRLQIWPLLTCNKASIEGAQCSRKICDFHAGGRRASGCRCETTDELSPTCASIMNHPTHDKYERALQSCVCFSRTQAAARGHTGPVQRSGQNVIEEFKELVPSQGLAKKIIILANVEAVKLTDVTKP